MPDIEVRRLRRDELPEILRIQADASHLTGHYPKHPQWLQKALSDVAEGHGRLAYGAFRVARRAGHVSDQLIGSAILTQPAFSSTGAVQLKNLVVSLKKLMEASGQADRSKARTELLAAKRMLLSRIFRFAVSRGFRQLLVEIPTDETEELAFYIGQGFSVVETRHDKYVPGDAVYLLLQSLPSVYRGDPLDVQAIAEWVIGSYFGQDEVLAESVACPPDEMASSLSGEPRPGKILKLTFSIPSQSAIGAGIADQMRAVWIVDKGFAGVLTNAKSISHAISGVDLTTIDHAAFVTIQRLPDIDYVDHKHRGSVRCLDRGWLERCTGASSTVQVCRLDAEDFAGTLLELHPACAPRLHAVKDELTFFVPNGIGVSRWNLNAEFPDRSAILYSQSGGPEDPTPGVWATADIVGVSFEPYEDARGIAADGKAVMTQSDFDYYMNSFHSHYSHLKKGEIACLKLANFDIFSQSVSLSKFLSGDVWQSLTTGEESVDDEQFDVTACYVDQKSLDQLAPLAEQIDRWSPQPKQVFLSYRTAEASSFIKDVRKHLETAIPELAIFHDCKEIRAGDGLKKTIESAIQSSDVILIFIGKYWRSPRSGKDDEIKDKNDWVRREVEWALRERDERKAVVLPVLINDARAEDIGDTPKAVKRLKDLRCLQLPAPSNAQGLDMLVTELQSLLFRKDQG